MESCFQTTSWQTPLSAEYYNCVSPSSPGSPVSSPSSPTLYQNSLCVKDNETSGTRIDLGLFKDSSGAVPSRSQNVCSLLEEIESLQTFDLSLPAESDWKSEINLALFEEVSPLEFSSPQTPTSQEFNHNQLAEIDEANVTIENEDENQFSAAYEEILESLAGNAEATVEGLNEEQLINCLFPNGLNFGLLPEFLNVAVTESATAEQNGTEEGQDTTQQSMSAETIADDIFMEVDVRNVSTELGSSYQYLSMSMDDSSMSSEESSISSEELDVESVMTEKMLNALIDGNLAEAAKFLPTANVFPGSVCIEEVEQTKRSSTKQTKKTTKSTKRPKKATNKVEKRLRKKQQNKEAALKYRMKMKDKMVVTLSQEQELQVEHDKLAVQKEELSKQVLMVKQLLRDVFSHRKSRQMK